MARSYASFPTGRVCHRNDAGEGKKRFQAVSKAFATAESHVENLMLRTS